MIKKFALVAALAALTSSAYAAGVHDLYGGIDLGRSDLSGAPSDVPDTYNSFGGVVGYQIIDHLGVEGGLRRLGHNGGLRANQTAVSVVASAFADGEWSRIGLFARLGLNHVSYSGSNGTYVGIGGDTKTMWGVGASYTFSQHFTGRIEYQNTAMDITNVSAALLFNF